MVGRIWLLINKILIKIIKYKIENFYEEFKYEIRVRVENKEGIGEFFSVIEFFFCKEVIG